MISLIQGSDEKCCFAVYLPTMTDDVRPDWLQGSLGQAVLARESAVVERALTQVFGLQMLQVGLWGAPEQFLQYAQTRCHSVICGEKKPGIAAISRPSRLAIASDSVDAVLLPHTLEIDPEPHQVLREVDRVLAGQGQLIVLGFNPYSAWGMRHYLTRGRFPSGARRFIPEKRMRDWLSLLGMEVSDCVRTVHIPPIGRESIQRRLGGMERISEKYVSRFAGVYILVAQKRVYSMTMRPQWSRKTRVIAGGLVKPSMRSAA